MNFNHRKRDYDTNQLSALSLYDTVDNMTDRANAIITLLKCQFTSETKNSLDDDLLFQALDAVSLELLDIKTIMKHYLEAQKQGQNNTQVEVTQ